MTNSAVCKFLVAAALIGTANVAAPGPALADGSSVAVATRTDPVLVLEVQKRLKEAGFYRGGLDGRVGPGTRAALKAFRISRGIAAPESADDWYNRNMALDEPLIRELFGLPGYGGSGAMSEVRLMKRLGIRPRSAYYRELYDFYHDYFPEEQPPAPEEDSAPETETGADNPSRA